MSTISGGAICSAINQYLTEVAGKSNPLARRTKTGLLDGLLSPMNTMGAQVVKIDQGNGTRKKVKMQYYQRQAQSEVDTDYPVNCDSSNEFALQETDFDIALKSVIDKKLTNEYVSQICAGSGWAVEQIFSGMFEAMQREINSKLINAANLSFGKNIATGSTAVETIDLLDGTNGKVKADEYTKFLDQIQNANQFMSAPIVAAGSSLFKATKLTQAGCCNDGGVDMLALTAQSGWSFFNDQMMDTELGTDEAVVWEPGSMQFVPWFKYRALGADVLRANGAYAAWQDVDGSQVGILRDPVSGMAYNFKVLYDKCAEEWSLFLELNYDLFTLPTDIYKAADHMAGFNGVLHYKFT